MVVDMTPWTIQDGVGRTVRCRQAPKANPAPPLPPAPLEGVCVDALQVGPEVLVQVKGYLGLKHGATKPN